MTALELLRAAASHGKSGRGLDALSAVRDAMQRPGLSPEEIYKAGRIIRLQTDGADPELASWTS